MLWRLPNVHELAASEEALRISEPRDRGSYARHEEPLYLAMFGKNVERLREDAEAIPTKYRPELLTWLMAHPQLPTKPGHWAASLLAEAVLDFYNRKAKADAPSFSSAGEAPEEEGAEELYETGPDLSDMEPFWWLK